MEKQNFNHAENIDINELRQLLNTMLQQVAAQEELLHQLQDQLAQGNLKATESARVETDAASSCPYCQCDWVYPRN